MSSKALSAVVRIAGDDCDGIDDVAMPAAMRSLRTCYVRSDADGMLGLHLSRAPWDPYPWISSVQSGSSAAAAGIRVGDCVLEVNGTDVLGQRIVEVAERIRSKWRPLPTDNPTQRQHERGVTFLLWNSRAENNLNPHSLKKFTTCLQSVAQLLECPVCLDVVRPPAFQCCHGHVLCATCRGRSTRCPVCRVPFGARGRCLIADQLFTLLAETFPCENKETGHKTCTAATPCSRSSNKSTNPHRNTAKSITTIPPLPEKLSTSTNRHSVRIDPPSSDHKLQLHCPHAADATCPRMAGAHELLTHLQRKHQTAVTQYYCTLGSRITVRFAERSICALAIPKNGQLELFLVLRGGPGDSPAEDDAVGKSETDTCWVWYVGNEDGASGYQVRMECDDRSKWRGAARSLDGRVSPLSDLASRREGCATLASDATSVVVEIK